MKTMQEFNRLVTVIALGFAGCALLVNHLNASVTLIASSDITDNSLSASDIESIFLGKKTSLPSGQKVKVITLKNGDTHDAFLSAYVNKSASQFSAFWKRKIVDGTGIPPKSFDSESDLINYVKSNSGIIGYVASGTAVDGLNTLSVQ